MDLRKLSPSSRNLIRELCITAYKRGDKKKTILKNYPCSLTSLNKWIRDYKKRGKRIYNEIKKGRKEGSMNPLSSRQEADLKKWITNKSPKDFSIEGSLWGRKEVQQLIVLKYNVERHITTIGTWLKKWGFTPQKPKKSL